MPVRDNGITLVNSGGSGPGTSVDITGPLGSQPAASSVSVAIASDQLPLPLSVTPTTETATGTLNLPGDFVEIDASLVAGMGVYLDSFGLSVPAIFQATVDEVNWELIQLSHFDNILLVQTAVSGATFGIFVGNVAGYKKFRVFAEDALFVGPIVVTIYAINVDRTDGLVSVQADNLDIRNLTFATDKVDASGSVVDTELPAAGQILVDNTITPTAPFVYAGGLYYNPSTARWSRAYGKPDGGLYTMPGPSGGSSGTLSFTALNDEFQTTLTVGFNSVTLFLLPNSFVGTLQFKTLSHSVLYPVFNPSTGKWITEITNADIPFGLILMAPNNGIKPLAIKCTAYTGGSIDVSYFHTQAVPWQKDLTNDELRASSLLTRITDSAAGTDVADVNGDNDSISSPKGLMMSAWDRLNNLAYPIPISGPNFALPTVNSLAIPVMLRNAMETNNAGAGTFLTNNQISVGGQTNAVTARPVRSVYSGDQFLTDAAEFQNPWGLATREQGQGYNKSGNLSVPNARFTVSARYAAKSATLFNLAEANPFSGTIKPIISLDNGVTWSFVSAIDVLTGRTFTELTGGGSVYGVNGTFAIPAANGATNFGWELTSRVTGDVNFRVASNSLGLGAMFAMTSPFGNTPVSGLVTEFSESYLPNDNKQLSMYSDGSLRVMTIPAPVPTYDEVVPPFDSGFPYDWGHKVPSVW